MSEKVETCPTKEMLKKASGLCIVTKTQRSSCPLAEMVARSGIEGVFPKLAIEVHPERGHDFKAVVEAGNYKGMGIESLDVGVGWNRPFVVAEVKDFVVISLLTKISDSVGRETPIEVGLKGIGLPDRLMAYQLLQDMFPKLSFQVEDGNLSFQERDSFAEQNIIPHPTINFNL